MNPVPPLPENKPILPEEISFEQDAVDYLSHIDKSLRSIKGYLEFITIIVGVSIGFTVIFFLLKLLGM